MSPKIAQWVSRWFYFYFRGGLEHSLSGPLCNSWVTIFLTYEPNNHYMYIYQWPDYRHKQSTFVNEKWGFWNLTSWKFQLFWKFKLLLKFNNFLKISSFFFKFCIFFYFEFFENLDFFFNFYFFENLYLNFFYFFYKFFWVFWKIWVFKFFFFF